MSARHHRKGHHVEHDPVDRHKGYLHAERYPLVAHVGARTQSGATISNPAPHLAKKKSARSESRAQCGASGSETLIGLKVELPEPCKCGSSVAVIGVGLHASLRCASCQATRGWLSPDTYSFITKISTRFGPLTAPITIRRGERISDNSGSDPECSTGS